MSINEDITEGNSLSSAMKKYPSIFDEIYTSTIYAGETSASLSEVFFDLSIYLDKEAKIRSQVSWCPNLSSSFIYSFNSSDLRSFKFCFATSS